MPTTMIDRAGNTVQVPDAEVVDRYESGQFGLPEGSAVDVVDASGGMHTVRADELDQALEYGYRIESPEERAQREEAMRYGTLGQTALTAAENLSSEASVGTLDVALGEVLGDEYREGRRLREKYNPGAAMAGRVAGALAPMLLSGGSTAGLTAGRLSARGLAGAAARGLSAPSRAAASAALRGEALTGRALTGLLGEGSIGARLGTRIGSTAVGGAIEGGIMGAGQVLSEMALAPGGDYSNAAERLLAGAKVGAGTGALMGGFTGLGVGAGAEALRRVPMRKLFEAGVEDAALRAVNPTKPKMRELQKRGDAARKKVNQQLLDDGIVTAGNDAEAMAKRAAEVIDESGRDIGRALQDLDDLGHKIDDVGLTQKVLKKYEKLKSSISGAEQNELADAMSREVTPLFEKLQAGELTATELRRARSAINRNQVKWASLKETDKSQMFKDIGKIYDDTIAEHVTKHGGPELLTSWKKAKDRYSAAKWAHDALVDTISGFKSNRVLGLTDYLTGSGVGAIGAVAGGAGGGLAAAGAAGLTNKFLRERGNGILADFSNRMLKADKAIEKRIRNMVTTAGRLRVAAVGEVARREVKERNDIDRLLEKRNKETRGQALARFTARSREISQNPRKLTGAIPAAAYESAPIIMAEATQKMLNAHKYLADNSPIPQPSPDSINPMQPSKLEPSPVDIAAYAKVVSAVKNPVGVLDEVVAGTATVAQMDALRATSPQLYANVRNRIITELATAKEPIDHERRINLGILFKIPTDPSLVPANLSGIQNTYVPAEAPPPAPSPTKTKMGEDLVDLHTSEAQQLQDGEII